MHDADAAPQEAGRQAGQVADDAAAQGEHQTAALDARIEKLAGQVLEMGEVLGPLALGQDNLDVGDLRGVEAEAERRQMQRGDRAVGDDGGPPARREGLDPPPGGGQQAIADDHVVARGGHCQSNGDGAGIRRGHVASSATPVVVAARNSSSF